ncbi:efflux RND transporter periplasmic adaptor subunit [Microscilla marina]|nr:efflux RND transporter periplasmic adaptor subunit [Microscilla marina]
MVSKFKKYLPILWVVLGIFIGWLLFGTGSGTDSHSGHSYQQTSSKKVSKASEVWTCSMHPQIRQPEPGQCPICGMDLILQKDNNSDDSPYRLVMTQNAVALAGIQTSVINEARPEKEVRLTGKIKMDERQMFTQVSHVKGRIDRLYVNYTGENIVKGQRLASLYAPGLLTAQKELIEALNYEQTNPALVKATRNKLRYLRLTEAQIKRIEKDKKVQTNFDIYADVSGVVIKRKVALGNYVQEGSPMFKVANLNALWVIFDAYESDLAWLKVGEVIKFKVAAYPDQVLDSRITFIDPMINPQTRTANVRAEILNKGLKLKPEMFVEGLVKAHLPFNNTALIVPKSAVMWTGKRSVVYIKDTKEKVPIFEMREVTLGQPLGNSYIIKEGLKKGEEVVTNGTFAIDAAAQLNNKLSMMNKNIEIKGQKNSAKKERKEGVKITDYSKTTPTPFKNQLKELVKAYLSFKDAFVKTDATQINAQATLMSNRLKKVNMGLLKGKAHITWMKHLTQIKTATKAINKAKNVEKQRTHFEQLSNILIAVVKSFGVNEITLYKQYCPMAFDNRGAFWLSDKEEIRNPYFGDKMLKCGSIKETIKF